jgi:hypothetical protein
MCRILGRTLAISRSVRRCGRHPECRALLVADIAPRLRQVNASGRECLRADSWWHGRPGTIKACGRFCEPGDRHAREPHRIYRRLLGRVLPAVGRVSGREAASLSRAFIVAENGRRGRDRFGRTAPRCGGRAARRRPRIGTFTRPSQPVALAPVRVLHCISSIQRHELDDHDVPYFDLPSPGFCLLDERGAQRGHRPVQRILGKLGAAYRGQTGQAGRGPCIRPLLIS